jgi:hypothetical protein
MIRNLYSIFDLKAQYHGNPFLETTDEVAMRTVISSMNADSLLAKHPEDFVLDRLGTYDDGSGEIVSEVELLIQLTELIKVDE